MLLEARFRLSIYLTLALASCCLAYAEEAFLPGFVLFIIVILMTMVAAFQMEGRWALSLFAANVVGSMIAVGWGCWMAYNFMHPSDFIKSAPFPAVFLPYLGPFLMVSMLAWLFCPKRTRDLWKLHAVGFIEVTLACILASESLFGLLLLAYLVCALWSLSLFHLYREQQAAVSGVKLPAPWPACRWVLIASAPALLLFLCTPQFTDSSWDPLRLARVKPIESGFSSTMDLTRTGQLTLSSEVAFEVRAENADGTAKLDLDLQTRWRGAVLETYEGGHWFGAPAVVPMLMTLPPVLRPAMEPSGIIAPLPEVVPNMLPIRDPPTALTTLPDLGPTQYFLTFTFEMQRFPGFFLAEPIVLKEPDRPPIVSLNAEVDRWRFQRKDWTIAHESLAGVPPRMRAGLHGSISYKQVIIPMESDVSISRAPMLRRSDYLQQPIAGLRPWTAQLLLQLRDNGQLDAGDFQTQGGEAIVSPGNRAKVGRALASYLSSSGDYDYTLNLRRKDRQLDPIEDFLINVKAGHCERFAAALAMMLRSCGIPSRVVLGFRGAEIASDDGLYVIRQSDAHSWVEALVYHPNEEGAMHRHWLTLDPTPSGASSDSATASSWQWHDLKSSVENFWRNFIVEYSTSQQLQTTEPLRALAWRFGMWVRNPRNMLGLAGFMVCLLGGYLLLQRWRRYGSIRLHEPPCELPCYDRLLGLLERHLGVTPHAAQTPREFALLASQALQARSETRAFVQLPGMLAELLYRIRYARQPVDEAEHQGLAKQVDALAGSLIDLKTVS